MSSPRLKKLHFIIKQLLPSVGMSLEGHPSSEHAVIQKKKKRWKSWGRQTSTGIPVHNFHWLCKHNILIYINQVISYFKAPYTKWIAHKGTKPTPKGREGRVTDETIDHFQHIKIQLGNEAWRTQTKEIEWPCLFISIVCVL